RDRERLAEIKREKKAERAKIKAEQDAARKRRDAARMAMATQLTLKPQGSPSAVVVSKPRRWRPPDAPKRERAVQAIIAKATATGQPVEKVNKYQIRRETGISHGVLDVAMEVAKERVNQEPQLQLNGGDPLAARGHAAWSKIDRGSDLWAEGVM